MELSCRLKDPASSKSMLFRRISEHVRAQNWAAVGIDFVIVVLGVLFALTAEQWMRDREQHAALVQVEAALNRDLLTNLFAARELKALAPCRKERVALLSQLLEQDEVEWDGLPWSPHPGGFDTLLPELLPTPYRYWGSRTWTAEQQTGTLSKMDLALRRRLEGIFNGTISILAKQDQVFAAQSELRTLAMERPISTSDRTRYLDSLHYYDQQAAILELMAAGTLKELEELTFTRDEFYLEEFGAYLKTYSEERIDRYGDCFTPFEMPFL